MNQQRLFAILIGELIITTKQVSSFKDTEIALAWKHNNF